MSIVVDLSWVTEAASLDDSNGSRTSQAAIVSARAARIVRLVRLLRLLRTVSLLSALAKQAMQRRKAADAGGAPSNIGGKLTDAMVTQVALAIIIMVITTALLTSWGVQPSPFDSYVNAFAAQAGATREDLQPEVDAMLTFAREKVSKQQPLTLRVGTVEWYWVEEAGGWPAQPSAAAKFASQPGANPPALLVVNVADQDAHDALLDTMLILSVLIGLLVYVFALNVTIYRTLVRPLERIFNIIRNNAAQVVAALGNGNDGERRNSTERQMSSDEDGDIGTIEAAVEKMSRILKHSSTQQQGTNVARALAADADDKTKAWLATMVGNGVEENGGGEAAAAGSASAAQPASPTSPALGGGLVSNATMQPPARGVRFSYFKNSSGAANSHSVAAAAAAAMASLPSARMSGASYVPSTPGTTSRLGTGSFGALISNSDFDVLASMAAYESGLTPLQKEALLSVDLETLHSFKLDVLSLPPEELTPHIVTMFIQLGLVKFSPPSNHEYAGFEFSSSSPKAIPQQQSGFVEVDLLWRFVDEVSGFYRDVPYHNLYHCVDVTHTTFLLLDRLRVPSAISPVECFSVMVAALAHDMDHPGVNNAYLVNVRDSLALSYNDASVLENRHVACLYALVTERPEIDIFRNLDAATWKEVRRIVIAAILHTDMTQHFPMVSKLEVFLELKAADIQAAHAAQRSALRGRYTGSSTSPLGTSIFSVMSASSSAYGAASSLPPVFGSTDERTLLLCAILHCADISNPARPAEIAEKWAHRVLTEFFAQGDREREAGQPISPLCDRATTSRAGSQINFIEFVVAPLYRIVSHILPDAGELLENCTATRKFWQTALLEEIAGDASKTAEEKKAEVLKAETRMTAFVNKYKDTLVIVSRRRRDIRRRLSTLPPSVTVAEGQSYHAPTSNAHRSISLVYLPVVPHSERTSIGSATTTGTVGAASRKASIIGSPTASSPLGESLRRLSQNGSSSDMAKAVAAALLSRGRSSLALQESPTSPTAEQHHHAGSVSPTILPPGSDIDIV